MGAGIDAFDSKSPGGELEAIDATQLVGLGAQREIAERAASDPRVTLTPVLWPMAVGTMLMMLSATSWVLFAGGASFLVLGMLRGAERTSDLHEHGLNGCTNRLVTLLRSSDALGEAARTGELARLEKDVRARLVKGLATPRDRWPTLSLLAVLLVAQWRLDEALELYTQYDNNLYSGDPRELDLMWRVEARLLSAAPQDASVEAVRRARAESLARIGARHRAPFEHMWSGLEGLALARLGRDPEAICLLEAALAEPGSALRPTETHFLYHLALCHERVGNVERALEVYAKAATFFAGTYLANEAAAHVRALRDAPFRRDPPVCPRFADES